MASPTAPPESIRGEILLLVDDPFIAGERH